MEDGEILAAIPSWSGKDGFHGLARYERAAEYWRDWANNAVWPPFQERMCSVLERLLGKPLDLPIPRLR